MKYKHTSTIQKEWSTGELKTFTEELTTSVINKINPNEKYMIGKLNLLKNDYHIDDDQMPLKDYSPRMIT